jgi:hypothetical protein
MAPPVNAPVPVRSGEPSGLMQPVNTTAEVANVKVKLCSFISCKLNQSDTQYCLDIQRNSTSHGKVSATLF